MIEYKGYLGTVDIDGDGLYGTVANLNRDHVDFRGKTVDDVRTAFQESVDFYLDGCRQDGEEPERPVLRRLDRRRRAASLGGKAARVSHVEVIVRNPAAPRRSWAGSFLVDTGVIDSLAPRPRLEAIGLKPVGQRVYQTADGREVTLDIAVARIDVMGEITAGVVIFGDADAEPLLGVTVLESAGLEMDPQNQSLKEIPSVRLKPCEFAAQRIR